MPKISISNIRETIETLCSWDHKIAGLPQEHEAAEYLKECLVKYGLTNINKQDFQIQKWDPKSCQLDIVSPIQKSIKAAILPYSQSSEVDAPLITLEQGDNDTSSKDEGAVALAEWGPRIYLSPYISYIRAVRRKMSGLILIAPNEGDLLKIVVISSGGFLKIPVVSISKEDGKILSDLTDQGEVHVKLITDVEVGSKTNSTNIEAIVTGNGEFQKEEIIVSSHYDSWFEGAADNSAPASIVLELARYIHEYVKNGGQLNRSIRFLFFGAEECGNTGFYYWDNGSRHYVNQNQNRIKNIAAVFSLDSIGFPPPTPNYIGATPELLNFIKSIKTNTKKAPDVVFYDPPGYGSDHWFFEISGVPTIYCVAFPSVLYHTQKDNPENLDYNAIEYYTNFLKEALLELGNLDLLPIDIFEPLERFRKIIHNYSSIKEIPFDFSLIHSALRKIMNKRAKFQKTIAMLSKKGGPKEIIEINKTLLNIANMYNKTIGWVWRQNAPDDIDYLAKFEYIADYMDISNAISSLRNLPVANIIPESAEKLEKQPDNPYNWPNIHQPLELLEQERSRIYVIIDEEIVRIRKMLSNILHDIDGIIRD